MRTAIVKLHQAGNGYRTVGKKFNVSKLTVRNITRKYNLTNTAATLPRKERPQKIVVQQDGNWYGK